MTDVPNLDQDAFESVVLLYLACAKLTDGDLALAEADRILEFTRAHTSDLAPSYAPTVVRDTAARLAALSDPAERLAAVAAAAERLGQTLSDESRASLVGELDALANADGLTSEQERSFVAAVAKTFGTD